MLPGFLTVVLHVIGEVVTAVLLWPWRRIRRLFPTHAARSVFNCNSDLNLVIVYPPREEEPGSILPRVAGEDFMAITHVLKIADIAGFPRDMVRMAPVNTETGNIEDNPDDGNLALVCAPWSNPMTGKVLVRLRNSCGLIAEFHPLSSSPANPPASVATPRTKGTAQYYISFYGKPYYSNTYEVQEQLTREHKQPWKGDMKDYGLIIKAPNPYNLRNQNATAFIIAGIRGIGTWGAAWYLCERVRDLYDSVKDGDFAAVIEVDYSDFRIMPTTHLCDFRLLGCS